MRSLDPSNFGPSRDTELGISDLEFYNYQFDAELGHADVKPRDRIMTMGLHTIVNFFMDNGISISNDPVEDIDTDSTYFHRIYMHANNELASGQEIAGGLTKSSLLYLHGAISRMENNTYVTTIAYTFIVFIVLLQLMLLSQRAGMVLWNYFGVSDIMLRFLVEMREIEHSLDRRAALKQKEVAFAGGAEAPAASLLGSRRLDKEANESDLSSDITDDDGVIVV